MSCLQCTEQDAEDKGDTTSSRFI